jgi:hypothetical protein
MVNVGKYKCRKAVTPITETQKTKTKKALFALRPTKIIKISLIPACK